MIVKVTTKFDRDGFDKRVEASVNAGIGVAAKEGAAWMKRGFGTSGRFKSSPAGQPPNRQRGFLANSVTSTPARNFKASAGTAMETGLIHEKGGIIRPKRVKWLPVPLNLAAQRMNEKRTGSLRDLKLVPIRTRNGNLKLISPEVLEYKQRSSRGNININAKPAWLLVKQVRIPARPWCVPAVEKNREAIANTAIRAAATAFRKGVGA